MVRHKIVHMGPVVDICRTEYEAEFDVHVIEDTFRPTKSDRAVAAQVRAVISYSAAQPHDLGLFPRLEFIASFGAGFDKIDLVTAARRGITVTNTPGATDECVADMALMLLLASVRRLMAGDAYVRTGAWQAHGMFPLTRSISELHLGILGLGRIGAAIAKRASAFGMRIGYHNRHAIAGAAYSYFASPRDLAAASDVLVVSCAGGPETRHLVNATVLQALGPDGFLVNVSRGSVVDETALINALRTGAVAGAGLDVFEREPLDPSSPLVAMENVVLMPHRGSATRETFRKMARSVVANLHAHFDGRDPINPVLTPSLA